MLRHQSDTLQAGERTRSAGGFEVIYLVTFGDATGFYYLKNLDPLWTTEHDDALAFASDEDASVIAQYVKGSVLCSARVAPKFVVPAPTVSGGFALIESKHFAPADALD